jgi:ribosome maturation factor RimP
MDQAALEAMIEETVAPMGYALVRVRLSGSPRATLQVMAERTDDRPMAVEDCEAISRTLSAKLDVEDPIASAYTLEVSSPGIDRPLTRPADYRRFAGHVARVETRVPVDGRRRFSGRIAAATDSHIRLTLDDGGAAGAAPEVEIAIADIARAKLKLTDELIAAHAGRN